MSILDATPTPATFTAPPDAEGAAFVASLRGRAISGEVFGLRDSVHIVDTTSEEVEKRVAPRAPILELLRGAKTALTFPKRARPNVRAKHARSSAERNLRATQTDLLQLVATVPCPFEYRKVHDRATPIDSRVAGVFIRPDK